MNTTAKKAIVYILLVIIPSAIISLFFLTYHSLAMKQNNFANAKEVADLYKYHLERLVGESISGLEMLAMSISIGGNDAKEIQNILEKASEKDPRFSGFYYSREDASIYLASHPLRQNVDVADRPYIQEAIQSKKTTLSPAIKGRVRGRNVVVAATPVLNSKKEVSGLLMASLRLDYMTAILKKLKPDYNFKVTDKKGAIILPHGGNGHSKAAGKVTVPLSNVPWNVTISPLPINKTQLYKKVAGEFFVTLFLTNIIFLFIQYALLKRRTEYERRQNEVQKLELVGTLAASAAHEIRNPLTGIKGLVTLLSEKHKNEEDQFYFSVIQKEIERINEIVSEFLILGKPTAVIKEIYDLKNIITEVSPIIQSEANLHSLHFITLMEHKPILIRCSKDHIKQVILNITKNAFEAMRPHDTLTIEASIEHNYAHICITDTGSGMPEHIKNKIFDPFFTSKEQGTGLGLVVCKRIVDMYNGNIRIESTEGKGTAFHVYLPLVESST
ncbi:MAG: ATP-binding protein [Ectobacillus sp.]